ncbi:hypothetical protein [Halobellus limi]|uniref:Uncharacterized protein n=1 Tax=Halobellus limi TaxID=699433 RepID=A0A1H5T2A2_9EURY|nr:hypothetical protein [Halobellus limi]SEF56278.1 hypothetical protein SAMN04488133_0134 [Halobellus limi]
MNGKAPVDKVGGPQEQGPWPSAIDEIVAGKRYRRQVDGSEVEIDVLDIRELKSEEQTAAGHTVMCVTTGGES